MSGNNHLKTRAEIGVAKRLRDPERLHAAKRDHAAAMLEQYVTKIVSSAPPLLPEQRDRIAALLRPAGAGPR